jgi:hypothetical protein
MFAKPAAAKSGYRGVSHEEVGPNPQSGLLYSRGICVRMTSLSVVTEKSTHW